jgi:PAS domain S-box-containing protein
MRSLSDLLLGINHETKDMISPTKPQEFSEGEPALQVLLLEDHAADVELIQAWLAQDGIWCSLVHVTTKDEFERVLDCVTFDIILADYAVPGFDGLAALQIARVKAPATPFILVSGRMGESLAVESLKAGAADYVLKSQLSRLAPAISRALSHARERRAIQEQQAAHAKALEMDGQLLEASADAILIADANGVLKRVNRQLELMFGYSREELIGQSLEILLPERFRGGHAGHVAAYCQAAYSRPMSARRGLIAIRRNGEEFPVAISLSPMPTKDGLLIGATLRDITTAKQAENELAVRTQELIAANEKLQREQAERQKIEVEMRLAHRLESIGQLAAGIAHEINTPMQYIGDSVHFLNQSFGDLLRLVEVHEEVSRAAAKAPDLKPLAEKVGECEDEVAIDYLRERVPKAIERTLDGVSQVASIVRAMKDFAHPVADEKSPADLNKAVRNALMVARNEYKYVAEIELLLEELPLIPCHIGEINQVLLNIIVNAAHAVADAVKGSDRRGVIGVQTGLEGEWAVIRIRDSGLGIPEAIRERIFDPFFTTKEVGKGTGQGLAIARSIVVGKHGGTLSFETEVGKGTTFLIRLPMNGDLNSTGDVPDEEANSLR